MLSSFHVIPSVLNPNLNLYVISDNDDIREKVLSYIDLMKQNEWKVELINNLDELGERCKND